MQFVGNGQNSKVGSKTVGDRKTDHQTGLATLSCSDYLLLARTSGRHGAPVSGSISGGSLLVHRSHGWQVGGQRGQWRSVCRPPSEHSWTPDRDWALPLRRTDVSLTRRGHSMEAIYSSMTRRTRRHGRYMDISDITNFLFLHSVFKCFKLNFCPYLTNYSFTVWLARGVSTHPAGVGWEQGFVQTVAKKVGCTLSPALRFPLKPDSEPFVKQEQLWPQAAIIEIVHFHS